jgi:hypothetical protein
MRDWREERIGGQSWYIVMIIGRLEGLKLANNCIYIYTIYTIYQKN